VMQVTRVRSVEAKTFPSPGYPYYTFSGDYTLCPLSYQWLLLKLASHISSTPENIDKHVQELELIYITPEKPLSNAARQVYHKFLRRYFITENKMYLMNEFQSSSDGSYSELPMHSVG
jgi:hypothetical protein